MASMPIEDACEEAQLMQVLRCHAVVVPILPPPKSRHGRGRFPRCHGPRPWILGPKLARHEAQQQRLAPFVGIHAAAQALLTRQRPDVHTDHLRLALPVHLKRQGLRDRRGASDWMVMGR